MLGDPEPASGSVLSNRNVGAAREVLNVLAAIDKINLNKICMSSNISKTGSRLYVIDSLNSTIEIFIFFIY